MKIKIELDIDWIEEDGSIDDEVKAEIISGVKRAISQSCLANMEEKSKKAIDSAMEQAAKKIEDKAIQFADEWLENEVEVTDKWGDVKEKTTIKGLVKSSFNDVLNRQVNDKGEFCSGRNSYGASGTLLEYLTGKRVQSAVSARLKDFGKNIDKQIEQTIEKGIRDRVSDKFAEMVIGVAKQDHKDAKALIQQ